MADARATQVPALTLTQAEGGARATQVPVLTLFRVAADGARATQIPALSLVTHDLEARVTQLPVLTLCRRTPCLTYWAQCWRIERRDGEAFTFTSHDLPVLFRGETYQPCDSLSGSAAELGAMLGRVGNAEMAGIISDDSITEEDLFAGLFDDARIEVWMVPWQSSAESPWRLLAGRTGKLSQGRAGYRMEVLTPGAQLQQAALVQLVTASCRFELGDARCTVDLGPLTVSGTVTALAPLAALTTASRRVFADSGRSEADGWFDRGILTWLTGANAGAQGEVKDFVGATGQFTLWEPMLNPIGVGDTYSVKPGCDKAPGTCSGKFGNLINFGGYRDVPGQDSIGQTPDAKQ